MEEEEEEEDDDDDDDDDSPVEFLRLSVEGVIMFIQKVCNLFQIAHSTKQHPPHSPVTPIA
jgi:hypothetical protein